MPRGHITFSKPGSRLKEESRRVLAYIREHQGCTRQALRAALPDLQINAKLNNLQTAGLAYSERLVGQAGVRFYTRTRPELVDEVKLRGPADGPIGGRRERDIHAPWREPYLSDVGVRSDGLQFRDCASRRGDALVYCWRRHA